MNNQECLNFVGIGAAFFPKYKNTAAWFVEDNVFYLIDCGESVFEKIYDNKQMLKCNRIVVILTHLHCDHCGSLGSLISYCYYILKKKIQVFHPSKNVIKLLELVGLEKSIYDYIDDIKKVNGVCKQYFVVDHAEDMECFGYHLLINEKNIYYSGDSNDIPDEVLTSFKEGKFEYIFHDTSLNKNEHHCYFEKLKRKIPLTLRNRFYCIHLDSPNLEKILKEGFQIPFVV